MASAQILGEALGTFELGGGLVRAEYRDVRCAAGIGDPGDQRGFGADHDQIDVLRAGKRDHCLRILDRARNAIRPARDPGIAGRRDQLVAAWRLRKTPRQRIFTPTRTQQ